MSTADRDRPAKYDLNKAAELQYGKLPQLKKQLEEEEERRNEQEEGSLVHESVTEEEIARIIPAGPASRSQS